MKYKLKKDLPFAKAGDEVIINKYEDVTTVKGHRNGKIFYSRIAGGQLHDECVLKKQGWIEEIKPREFWLLECRNPSALWTEEEKNKEIGRHPNFVFVKYVEVLE